MTDMLSTLRRLAARLRFLPPLLGTMIVAILTAILPDVSGVIDLLGRVEVLYIVLFVWLAVAGPGPVSLDGLVARLRNGNASTAPPSAGDSARA